jgi:hypothetical protein
MASPAYEAAHCGMNHDSQSLLALADELIE